MDDIDHILDVFCYAAFANCQQIYDMISPLSNFGQSARQFIARKYT